MNKYKVSFYYEISTSIVVKAKNKAEAEKIVFEQLENDGADIADSDYDNREYDITGSELVK